MSKFYKDLAGSHFETLAKAIYKESIGQVVDPQELYLPLMVLPRALISWAIQNIAPMKINESKQLKVPGSDATLEIRKIVEDCYSGSLISKGKQIHHFEKVPLPTVAGNLLTALNLYEDVAQRPVEEIEKQEIAEKSKDDKMMDMIDKLGSLIDKIVEVQAQSVKKEEIREAAPVAAPQPVVVNVTLSNIGNSEKPEVKAEVEKEAEEVKKEEIKPELDKAKMDENLAWGEKRKERQSRQTIEEKGVHKPDSEKGGQSYVGSRLRASNAPDSHMAGISSPKSLRPSIKAAHQQKLSEMKAQPKPNLPKAELDKAAEDKQVPAQHRKQYRIARRKDAGHDILADQTTSVPGVSDRGIEARRADERTANKFVAHGYARTTDAATHKTRAKEYFRKLAEKQKASPKPDLPKAELEKKAPSMEGPSKVKPLAAQAPTPKVGQMKGAAKKPALNAPKDTVSPIKARVARPAQGPKMPSSPQPPQPQAMKRVASVGKKEIESAVSDSGKKLFMKDEFGKYRFNPTGLWAVMNKDSVDIKKSENDNFEIHANPEDWDSDNLNLLKAVLKAKTLLKKYGF